MRVLISGATGFIGTALTAHLKAAGREVVALTRHPRHPQDIAWDPVVGRIDALRLEGFDAVVNLAGESLSSGRWNRARKARMRASRVQGTALLARTLADRPRKPRVFVSASAIGYYGDRGDERLDEHSAPGHGFLADTAVAWEAAAQPAVDAGIRVVHPRIGVVLSPHGGALEALLPTAQLGLGVWLSNGRQYWSWVTLDDLVAVLAMAIDDERLHGPVNVVAPAPVRQKYFARTLGSVLSRPVIMGVPGFALAMMLGEMAEVVLLSSQRVQPAVLGTVGYRFRDPELEPALRRLLRRV